MNIEEFEAILEGATESRRIDFKNSCSWDVTKFAKDILAMSNLQDGGYLIIGVEDKSWTRLGIKDEHKKTYSLDIMKDQMASYADPPCEFYSRSSKR